MLDDELIVETPERVELHYVLANIGNRFLAAILDHLFQLLAIIALIAVLSRFVSSWGEIFSMGVWAAGLAVLIIFLIVWGYFVFFETFWSGQTPGKRIMGLRVIRDDGRPVRFFEAFVRNLLRIAIDFQPSGSFAVGVVSTIFSEKSKRVGDYVAGTVVVKERSLEAPSLEDVIKVSEMERLRLERSGGGHFKIDARQLKAAEVKAMQAFLMRRYELPEPKRTNLARQISGSLAAKLGLLDTGLTPEAVLEEIDRQYRLQVKYFD
ncbi:MAG TPA: RDD family protein [Blastocatellia bacterium]